MKNPVVINAQFIFDADGEVWRSEEDFKESIGKAINDISGRVKVLLEDVDDNHAEYIFYVTKSLDKPSMNEEDIPEIAK